jgi:hypothetical protein
MNRCCLVLVAALGLAGCWNGENVNLRMGDVSLGQQLIDLQRAREAGAIDDEEYQRVRTALVAISALCEKEAE